MTALTIYLIICAAIDAAIFYWLSHINAHTAVFAGMLYILVICQALIWGAFIY